MATKAYIGNNGISRNIPSMYVGVDGVARKISKAYVGVDGVARLFFDSIPPIQFFNITYHANGGMFSNELDTNVVEYSALTTSKTIKKISKTKNVSDDGTADTSTGYGDYISNNDIITIDGAKQLKVTITYATESTSYDWVCVYDNSVTPSQNNYSSSISGKLGGTNKQTKTFIVNGDTAQIYFKSDSSISNYYGYYAVIVGTNETTTLSIISGIEENPIKDQCIFMGWYLDPECTDGNEFNINNIQADTTVYAKWEIKLAEDLVFSLIDFEYEDNKNGTVTLTAWKGTLNGVPSTELVIPNDSRIIL